MLIPLGACGAKNSTPPEQPGYVDAVELKELKCRELADQMLATVPNDALRGFVAMPTSFVNENNTNQSSPLGRLMAESMFYEFNQRGFPTREYRLTGNIAVVGGKMTWLLSRQPNCAHKGTKMGCSSCRHLLCGQGCNFVNVRLVRASDGLVLRTGQLVLANTPVVARMGSDDGAGAGFGLSPISSALYPSACPYTQKWTRLLHPHCAGEIKFG